MSKAVGSNNRTNEAIRKADRIGANRGPQTSRKGTLPLTSGEVGGTTEKWAKLTSGSGLTYVADIYSSFSNDMKFTSIIPDETGKVVKVVFDTLNTGFDLTVGQAYPVAKFDVSDGGGGFVSTWIIMQHPGIS